MALGKAFILLPAFNEERALTTLIPAIERVFTKLQMPYRIVVADDGSRDATAGLLQKLGETIPIEHLRHAENQGYGAALNTGFYWIATHAADQDVALCLDADNTQDPRYFPAMIEKLKEGYDVVTGSYTMRGGRCYGVPLLRRVLSIGINVLFKAGIPLAGARAYTNGFRAIRVDVLRRVQALYSNLIEETGFAGGTELFLRLARAEARLAEVPFDLHYEMRGNQSKIHIRHTIRGYLHLLKRYGWWSNG